LQCVEKKEWFGQFQKDQISKERYIETKKKGDYMEKRGILKRRIWCDQFAVESELQKVSKPDCSENGKEPPRMPVRQSPRTEV